MRGVARYIGTCLVVLALGLTGAAYGESVAFVT